MRHLVLMLALFASLAQPAAAADPVAAAQAVISAQEQAFRRDDGAAAYDHAAPGIRDIFPTADHFMAMVRNQYAPVYRHRSFEFGASKVEGDWIAQQVHIIDADGEAWEALYTLEVQPDGKLKITGCRLLRAGQSA